MNRLHAWDSAVWRDTIPTQPGLLTEQHLDDRLRERAAIFELADQLEREARHTWPPRRARPLTGCTGPCEQGRRACPSPQACERGQRDDDDGFDLFRGLLVAVAFTAVCLAVALLAAALLPKF
jgi:hypothetical protein